MTAPTDDLAVAMCTQDSMRTLDRSLRSVHGLATRLVIVDSGSRDGTIELCRSHGAEIIHRAWAGFIAHRQFALDLCRDHAWVLLLDSDESLEPPLRDSILAAIRRGGDTPRGYALNRKLWFLDGWVHHVFQPEWRLRLVRGGVARIVGREPHDAVVVDGPVERLAGDLRHDSWADAHDMLARALAYARQAADAGASGGSAWKVLTSGPAALFKQLIVKGGVRDGRRGLIAAVGAAVGATQKHLLLAARRRQRDGSS
jgi:glycosyltransferase involved in cell wall biosynthesis